MMYMPGGDNYTPNPGPIIDDAYVALLVKLMEKNRGKSLHELLHKF